MMVFGMHHQLGGSTEDNMNKMSVIGHISLIYNQEPDYIIRLRLYIIRSWSGPDYIFRREKKTFLYIPGSDYV